MLDFPHKALRARVIAEWVRAAGYPGVVCFSCGHASRALKDVGLYCVEVAPTGALQAGCWWSPEEIHRCWPHLLDATSGHLPAPLMTKLADAYKAWLGDLTEGATYRIATGSGETVLCLKIAYPDCTFIPYYDNSSPSTTFSPAAPLNSWVESFFPDRPE